MNGEAYLSLKICFQLDQLRDSNFWALRLLGNTGARKSEIDPIILTVCHVNHLVQFSTVKRRFKSFLEIILKFIKCF